MAPARTSTGAALPPRADHWPAGPTALGQGYSLVFRQQKEQSPLPTQAPLPGIVLHKENGDPGSWTSINTLSPVYLISSQRKGAHCLPQPPPPHAGLRTPSSVRVCLPVIPPPLALWPQPKHQPEPQVPALLSLCFFMLLSPPCCHTCGVCVYGTCCVLPPSTQSVWLFPTTPLFRHCSQPRLHGANPETMSWFLCTWPLTPLVLESLVRMLSPWAPGHHLLPLSLLPVEFPSRLNTFLPGVSSLAWHVAPAQTSLQTRQPSCSSISFLLSPAQTFHGQLNLCPGPWLGSLCPLPFLPDGGGREPCSFVLTDAPFGFVVGSRWPFPAPTLADQG